LRQALQMLPNQEQAVMLMNEALQSIQ
jgi:hypothetical protein